MSIESLHESPLQAAHLAAGARLIDFVGWNLPVHYAGILPEHRAVRAGCGMFDISHMGQLFVSGNEADAWLNRQLTNDVAALAPGMAHYTFILNEHGGFIDDLLLYRLTDERFLLLVNASKVAEDEGALKSTLQDGLELRNASDAYAGLAIQGPDTTHIARAVWPGGPGLPQRNGVITLPMPHGDAFVCRTGYTGEDGFEIFLPNEDAQTLWEQLIALGVTPCGLGARDTLRLEMGYPLNGSDLSDTRTPLEAGLSFFVSMKKPSFVGKDALVAQTSQGVNERLAGLVMTLKGPPLRAGYAVHDGETKVGTLTSGCLSPSLGDGIGMAYLPGDLAKPGRELEVVIRDRRFPVTTVKKPFYRPPST